MNIQIIDSKQAFEDAIKSKRLSNKPSSRKYAGKYMYMGTSEGFHLFKHIDTREYLN